MDKKRILLLSIITVTLVITTLIWGIPLYSTGKYWESISIFLVALLIALFGFKIIYNFLKQINKGLPLEDERSQKIKTTAAAYAFYIGLYWILALMWFEDILVKYIGQQDMSVALGGAILGESIIFGIAYLVLSKIMK